MSQNQVVVIARIRAKPGMENVVREELMGLLEPTRKEAGCINYNLHQSAENPGHFLFHETWGSKDALDRHLESSHIQATVHKGDNIFDGTAEISLWKKIG
jgi:quinol monooxygenase YgiN